MQQLGLKLKMRVIRPLGLLMVLLLWPLTGYSQQSATIRFVTDTLTVNEGDGTAVVAVEMTGCAQPVTNQDTSLRVAGGIPNGTAFPFIDYNVDPNIITNFPFINGNGTIATLVELPISLVNDREVEPANETIGLSFNVESGHIFCNDIDDFMPVTTGSPNTMTITIEDNDFPLAVTVAANRQTINVGDSVSYTSTLTGGSNPPNDYSYQWTFGDGANPPSSTEANPTVQYNTDGSHRAALTVTDSTGAPAFGELTIQVNPVNIASQLRIAEGNNQTITVGNASDSLIVEVKNEQGSPLSGQMVSFFVSQGDGDLSATQVLTDSNGQASTIVTPKASGPLHITAGLPPNANIAPVEFTLTAKAAGNNGLLHNIDGLNANQQAVALTIDTICPSRQASAELLARCDALIGNRVSDAVAADALTQIAPEEAISQTTQSVQMAAAQVANVKSRLLALRGGAQGFNASGFALAVDGQVLSGAMLAQAAQEAAHQRGGSAGDGSSDSRWGVFVNGQVKFGDQDATTRESGFDFDTQGLTVGADYRVSDTYIVGAALGFARTGNDMANNAGKVDSDGITGSLYGNFTLSENLYFDWIAQYGWNNYESTRNFNYEESPGAFVIGSNQGDNDGSQYGIDFSLGYDMPMGSLNVGGYGRLSYSTVNIDGYQETSAQNLGLNMRIGEQDIDSLTTALGVRLSYASSQNWGVLMPQLTLEWEHQYQDDSRLLNVVFVDDFRGLNFQLQTDSPDRNYFNVGLGLSVQFSAGRSAFIQYESILGLDEVDSHSITAGVRIAF